MPQSLSSVYLHVVFSTKDRRPFLSDPDLREEAHRYLGGISNGMDCIPVLIGGVEDHVHILTSLARTVCIADYVKRVKTSSNTWIKSKGLGEFSWQSGYGAFSVAAEGIPSVRRYILRQPEHHKTQTFQDEFLALLTEHGLTWDERYVWD